ncbi:hypothetical protein CDAR_613591 [Caerostris darwini]|uniref:Uncharacterized protein n=1 Tax=Caerostris darwini TaxID=1538125 RepID=A0AAV4RU09_9ARAC|nr:hypothetical protein CDAR_613591 [Caerostris darwini]
MTEQRQHLGTPQWTVVSLPWLVDCPHIDNCLVTTLKTTPEEYMPGKHENHLCVQNNIRKELFGHMIFHINGLPSPALFKYVSVFKFDVSTTTAIQLEITPMLLNKLIKIVFKFEFS